jgi:nucleotide-binding universal stress UspA family protein
VVERERAEAARQLLLAFPDDAPPLEVVQAPSVEEGLEAARARHRAEGVVVARAAPSGTRRVFRLGAVARALLRRLACPVVVVPPETAVGGGAGPIVALSGLDDGSVEACRLARALAARTHRALALAHVAPPAGGERQGEAPAAARAEAALARWAARHEVWPDHAVVLEGGLEEAALAFAEARHAPLVALGAVPAEGLRGALGTSAARRLAAIARQPVLVAPARPAPLRAAAEREAGSAP